MNDSTQVEKDLDYGKMTRKELIQMIEMKEATILEMESAYAGAGLSESKLRDALEMASRFIEDKTAYEDARKSLARIPNIRAEKQGKALLKIRRSAKKVAALVRLYENGSIGIGGMSKESKHDWNCFREIKQDDIDCLEVGLE